MPRRNHRKKANKRHRKGSIGDSDRDGNTKNEAQFLSTASTSLEEDLRQQRIRQQGRQKRREMEEKEEKNERDHGGMDLDEDEDCNNHDVDGRRRGNGNDNTDTDTDTKASIPSSLPVSAIRLPSSFLLRHVEQTSPLLSMHKRNYLRKLWIAQYHLETMTIQPRAASLYSKTKWPQHTLEYNSDLKCYWDLSCKHRLHPSARTFDLAMLDDAGFNGSSSAPTIATIFQDGWGLLRQESRHKINTIKAPPAYAIRMHESSRTCGMIVRPATTNRNSNSNTNRNNTNRPHHHRHHMYMSPYAFRWYPLPHATSYVEAQLPRPVTDFCFGNEIALFSCPRYSSLSSESLNPLFLPLVEAGGATGTTNTYTNSPVRSINVRNFPQSDALRIEMMCKHQEKLLGFGHRNGQVSILDLRATGTVCSILQCEDKTPGQTLGSVSDLAFRSEGSGFGGGHRHQHQHQVLVKRSFGSCQLHDLRKSSTSSPGDSNSRHHTSTTVVHNMVVPPNEINATLSANCNGFFLDPNSKRTMMSPYIANPSGDARLGAWSLDTGLMVGSRLLMKKKNSNSLNGRAEHEHDSLYVEVCSQTTPMVVSNSNSNHHQPSDTNFDVPSSSSFGVWLKCGAFTTQSLPSKVGSLQQLSIPGQWAVD
eukprot:jgi/Psemu1/199925/e_gw1.247.47.1